MRDTHPSLLMMFSIILVLGLALAGLYFGLVPAYIGKIIAEAGNVTRLDIGTARTTAGWDGIYGTLTLIITDNNQTLQGGEVNNLNLTVPNLLLYLDPSLNIYASNQSSINVSVLVPATPAEVDSYLGVNASDMISGTRTFMNVTNFTVDNVSMALNSSYTLSPVEDFDLGILKDNNTGNLFFVTHIKPGGVSYNGNPADFQLMLPVRAGETPIYYIFTDTTLQSYGISLYTNQNWFSYPLIPSNNSITAVLDSIGKGAGIQHELWGGFAGCTGNAIDNYIGNYTVIWTYNATDLADHWKDFNPTKPCHQIPTQEIQNIKRESNYQITMISDDILRVLGSQAPFTAVPVYLGVNWIGYPTAVDRNVVLAMTSLGYSAGMEHESWGGFAGCTGNAIDNYIGNYTVIWTYDATDLADHWKDFNPTKPCHQIPTQEIQELMAGMGYYILMTENDTWYVDW